MPRQLKACLQDPSSLVLPLDHTKCHTQVHWSAVKVNTTQYNAVRLDQKYATIICIFSIKQFIIKVIQFSVLKCRRKPVMPVISSKYQQFRREPGKPEISSKQLSVKSNNLGPLPHPEKNLEEDHPVSNSKQSEAQGGSQQIGDNQ